MNQAVAETAPIEEPIKLKIVGMDCGSCAMTIESSMRQLSGVENASVSFTTETMEVTGKVELDEIESRLRELGYRVADESDAAAQMAMPEHRGLKGFLHFLWEQPPLRRALMVTAAVFIAVAIVPASGVGPIMGIPALTLIFGSAVLIAGAPVFIKGFRSLIFARRVTIDLLMAIAAFGAISIGETGEAVTVILLFMLGEALEAYSAERARDSLRTLMSLQPQEACVLEAHGDSHDHGNDHAEHEHAHEGHEHAALKKADGVAGLHDHGDSNYQ
jgi:Cd2+/Zn2+-exporting ATPase